MLSVLSDINATRWNYKVGSHWVLIIAMALIMPKMGQIRILSLTLVQCKRTQDSMVNQIKIEILQKI